MMVMVVCQVSSSIVDLLIRVLTIVLTSVVSIMICVVVTANCGTTARLLHLLVVISLSHLRLAKLLFMELLKVLNIADL